ncbi:7028_t:CDS:10 [Paraglomus occultum]|uniref:7028_t:CDS:1 n=1 Tax=Paraglomus occultum TaxID=144539 RepID=A0A9N9AM52_9GLOM|nr:7028_t:CDS:10 [Paraglomus occultum]
MSTTNTVVPRDEILDPFLLPLPVWINDETVKACKQCSATFTPLRRKHHCRQCGHIFCQNCSSQRLALPQLGEFTPVRVCNECFRVASLVGEVISDGQTTQIHGARGLAAIVDQGKGTTATGITRDFRSWFKIDAISNILLEQEISILIDQGGLDALIYLCKEQHLPELHFEATTALAKFVLIEDHRSTLFMKGALPYLYVLIFLYAQRASAKQSDINFVSSAKLLKMVSEILRNAESLSQRMLMDKAFDAILTLAGFELDATKIVSAENSYDEIRLKVEEAQVLAVKTISSLAFYPTNQLQMIEGSDNGLTGLIQLLHAKQPEVRRYVAKSIAYLSTRNDKYKSMLVQDGRAELLASVIPVDKELAVAHQMTIAHTACALANLATNDDSQKLLIGQPNILPNLCNIVFVFLDNKEVQRHLARLLANFALYEKNRRRMIEDVSVVTPLIAIGDSPVADSEIHKHIVRAFDNLSTKCEKEENQVPINILAKLIPSSPLINRIAETIADEEVRRRAAHVINKLDQLEKLLQKSDEEPTELSQSTSSLTSYDFEEAT